MQNFLSRLIPFLVIGFMIVILIAGLVLLSYLLIFGAIVGFILFAITWLREKFFPKQDIVIKEQPPKSGRIINHDELK